MRYGVALAPFVDGSTDDALRALDAFAARSRMPDLVPVWTREWRADARLFRGIRERGAEPVAYVETQTPTIPVDTVLRFADEVGHNGTVVRLNQEMDGDWGAPWQSWEPSVYALHWATCRFLLGPNFRLWWCPSIPRRAFDGGWWPGQADIVGCDRYAWEADDAFPPEQFAGPIRQLDRIAPGVVKWVGEHGSKAGIPRRAERLRSLEDVDGAEVVVVMNLAAERPDGGVDHWEWTPSQDRAFKGMVSA